MADEFSNDDLIFAGRGSLCEYIDRKRYKIIRFSGTLEMRDWEFLADLYTFMKGVDGACVLDLSPMTGFDATLYTVLVWARILRGLRGTLFLAVAPEEIEARLRLAGIHKWLPIIRDLSIFDEISAKRPTPEAKSKSKGVQAAA